MISIFMAYLFAIFVPTLSACAFCHQMMGILSRNSEENSD